jgi:hypothetical protein
MVTIFGDLHKFPSKKRSDGNIAQGN